MTRARNRELDALAKAPAFTSPDEVKTLLRDLDNVSVSALVVSGLSGARLLEILANDRAFAVEFAAASVHARETAKVLRRLAGIFSEGAQRVTVAMHVRPDRAEILAEAL